MGHTTEVARNGREALEAASRQIYDIVLLDIQMPEMDGYEAARALRADVPAGTPRRIIGFSGEAPDREWYVSSGMDDFLVKPVRPRDLERILRPSLEARDHGLSLARDFDHALRSPEVPLRP
jgi:CheY-like chemotaxis protein